MPRTVLPPPMGQPLLPDLPNWAWHEYGMRVGFWRLLEVLRHFGITPTLAINGNVCNSYPRIAEAALAAGWEFMGHGFVQGPMHRLDDQRGAIRDTIEAIRSFTGTAPRGWESPGLTETYETPDLLREEGIEYVADWVLDDQPVLIETRAGPLVSIPYTLETNDITVHALQHLPSDALLPPRRRPVRAALSGERHDHPDHGDQPAPYITGVAASDRASRDALRPPAVAPGRPDVDRRPDLRLVRRRAGLSREA